MRGGDRGESNRALEVLTERLMVSLRRVGLKNIVAVNSNGVDVFAVLASVEHGVVVATDGGGDGIG